MSGKVKVWGNVVTVEWADPIEDPDPEVMAKVSFNTLGLQKMNVSLFINLLIAFLISCFSSFKNLKNVNQCFLKPKMTSLNVRNPKTLI